MGGEARSRRPSSKEALAEAWVRSLWGGVRNRQSFRDVETFCLFIGHPRSGHTLVGTLLNAHPDVVIAHELDALRYVDLRFRRNQIYQLILEQDRMFTGGGSVKREFNYKVPDEWQGRFRTLLVIGDKRGNSSIRRLDKNPQVLDRLRRVVGVKVRIIHVARNPFDNITTMARRAGCGLDKAIDRYFRSCAGIVRVTEQVPSEVLDMTHEALVANPTGCLVELCDFLEIEPTEAYLTHCASVVYSSPRKTRDDGDWSQERIERVQEQIAEFSFLAHYSYAQ